MEESSRKKPTTEELDSTVLQRTDANLQGTSMELTFLSSKRKSSDASSASDVSVSMSTPTVDVRKRICFDESAIEDCSISSGMSVVSKSFQETTNEPQEKAEKMARIETELKEAKLSKAKTMGQFKLPMEKQTDDKESASSKESLLQALILFEGKRDKLKCNLREAQQEASERKAEADEEKRQLTLLEKDITVLRTSFAQSREAALAKIPEMGMEILQTQQINSLHQEASRNENDLENKIYFLEEKLKERNSVIAYLEVKLKEAHNQLFEWNFLAKNLFDADSVSDVGKKVEEIKTKEAKWVEEIGFLTTDLNDLKRLNASLEDQIDAFKQDTKIKSELEDCIKSLERKLSVVEKDRDHLLSTHYMLTKTIEKLEKLVDEYRSYINSTSDAAPKDDDETHKKVDELDLIEHLKFQLEYAFSKLVAPDTRVLHFINNPLDNGRNLTIKKLAHLEKENEALRERIRLMEAGETSNLTLLVGEHFEQGFTPEHLKDLEEQLQLKDVQLEVMKQEFADEMESYKRAIFELFGYDVTKDTFGYFNLVSVHDEPTKHNLKFKLVEGGMESVKTDYFDMIDDSIKEYLTIEGSIAAFLSALTLQHWSQ